MADQWHFSINGKQAGPISSSELKQLASSGRLSRNDLVWKDGLPNWVAAEKLKGLFPALENSFQPTLPPRIPPLQPSPPPLISNTSSIAGIDNNFLASSLPRKKPSEALAITMLVTPVVASLILFLVNLTENMQAILGLGTVCITGILGFIDAKSLGMGSPTDLKPTGKKHAGPIASAIGIIGVWIIGFPLYFNSRKRFGSLNLLLPSILVTAVFLATLNFMPGDLPEVDAPEVTQTLRTLLREQVMKINPEFTDSVATYKPVEISFDSAKQQRVARVEIKSQLGTEVIYYLIEWDNRSKNLFWVKIIPNPDGN